MIKYLTVGTLAASVAMGVPIAPGQATPLRPTALITVQDAPAPTKPGASVAVNDGFSCAVVATGRVKCWGEGGDYQLGRKTARIQNPVPVAVPRVRRAVSVTAGWDFACALLRSGSVMCWGSNSQGQLGLKTSRGSKAVRVEGVRNAVSLSAASEYVCAALASGKVKCWGSNWVGQLGIGQKAPPERFRLKGGFTGWAFPTPVRVPRITTASAVSSGAGHACALLKDGRVSCWGDNGGGEVLGYTTQDDDFMKPHTVAGVADATAVSAGRDFTCALLSDTSVTCWGNNEEGQLGSLPAPLSEGSGVLPPTTVPGVTGAAAIAANNFDSSPSACAVLLEGGRLVCWGNAGTDTNGDPRPVEGLEGVTSVSLGDLHRCISEASAVKCWGHNVMGQVGVKRGRIPKNGQLPKNVVIETPVKVKGL